MLWDRVQRLDEAFQEWRLGIRTLEFHKPLDDDRPECRGYGPTSFRDWRLIRPHLMIDPPGVFVDYGSGLGRVVILAAQLPFISVLGIEKDLALVKRASANIKRARCHLRAPTALWSFDVIKYEPARRTSVFYFCNPFSGTILAKAMDNIRTSVATFPRPIQIVCNLPQRSAFENEIGAVDWLKLTKDIALTNKRKCLIFTINS